MNAAIGGSTNAVIHLLAIAGRIGVPLELEDWDKIGSELPCLVNLQPSGKYLMEDFYYAGGLPAVMREIAHVLDVQGAHRQWQDARREHRRCAVLEPRSDQPLDEPFKAHAGIAVLRGNLAPDGAVIKPSAASPHLLRHRGRAVVFENIEDLHARIDDENLDIDENCIMVLKGCGPEGYPGMAEVGNMPLPPKLLRRGITDILRISDARMSAHAPMAPWCCTCRRKPRPADRWRWCATATSIEVDVPARRLHLDVSDTELAARRAQLETGAGAHARLCTSCMSDHVQQAHLGADLDVLVGGSGMTFPRLHTSSGAGVVMPGTKSSVRYRLRHVRAHSTTFGAAPPCSNSRTKFKVSRRLAQHQIDAGGISPSTTSAAPQPVEHQHQRRRHAGL